MEQSEQKYRELASKIQENINSVFVGKESVVEKLVICLLAGGHVLLEDVPGVGKTTLAGVLARTIQGSFARVQFTPDTLPGDIVGISVYNQKTQEFEYRQGVIMHQILLTDEINRTAPKTQASLLEAMAEGQVTVDGVSYKLPQPFMVIATQNPVEFLGTYPLPEAQMDRFLMRLSIGYPDAEREIQMARQFLGRKTPDTVEVVCTAEDIVKMQDMVKNVKVSDAVLGYMEEMVTLTRQEERFLLGASPRALLAFVRASQAKAFLEQRDFVKPDDVKAMADSVLRHRITLTSEARIHKEDVEKILKSLILKAKVPV